MVLSQTHCFRPCLVLLRNAHSAVESNHYKTLGLNSSATKAEIKAAYYELSKKHHPDRNKGSEESARIFKLVKAAYEVLGNEQRRIEYDRDRIFKAVRKPKKFYYPDNSPDYKDEAERIHFHSRARPPFRKYSYGKTSYYDFDAWYEGHYGKQSEFSVRHPKQFKFTYNKFTEKEIQMYDKVKSTFIFIFYLMIFLSTISVCTSNKKRTI